MIVIAWWQSFCEPAKLIEERNILRNNKHFELFSSTAIMLLLEPQSLSVHIISVDELINISSINAEQFSVSLSGEIEQSS